MADPAPASLAPMRTRLAIGAAVLALAAAGCGGDSLDERALEWFTECAADQGYDVPDTAAAFVETDPPQLIAVADVGDMPTEVFDDCFAQATRLVESQGDDAGR